MILLIFSYTFNISWYFFSSFFLFIRIIQGSCSYLYLFFLFFLLYVAVDTKPCWRRHWQMFMKESNGKYLFCHKSRLRWYSSNKFRPSLLCVSCLDRMVSDFLIGFEWKLNKLWKFYKLYTVFVEFMVDMSFL